MMSALECMIFALVSLQLLEHVSAEDTTPKALAECNMYKTFGPDYMGEPGFCARYSNKEPQYKDKEGKVCAVGSFTLLLKMKVAVSDSRDEFEDFGYLPLDDEIEEAYCLYSDENELLHLRFDCGKINMTFHKDHEEGGSTYLKELEGLITIGRNPSIMLNISYSKDTEPKERLMSVPWGRYFKQDDDKPIEIKFKVNDTDFQVNASFYKTQIEVNRTDTETEFFTLKDPRA